MGQFKDRTGMVFGTLTVIKYVGKAPTRHSIWLVECSCGNVIEKSAQALADNSTCGVYENHRSNVTHNLSKSPEYRRYYGIIQRCYNPKSTGYDRYGGRGITVCQEWLDDFMNFHTWINTYENWKSLTVDRVDVNGPYSPANCRMATAPTQHNNKRNSKTVEYQGVKYLLRDLVLEFQLDLHPHTIASRLRRGEDLEDAMYRPHRRKASKTRLKRLANDQEFNTAQVKHKEKKA